MALATRCPHCSTTFRVANDQLKLHAGLVRCGKCQQTFNGVENLIPLDAHGRALSQSLPGQNPGEAAPAPHQNPSPVTATTAAIAAEPDTPAAPLESSSVIEVASTAFATVTPESKTAHSEAIAAATTEQATKPVVPSAFVESKALRSSEPAQAAAAIQHLSTIKRPEVWRHAPAQPAVTTPATPVKTEASVATTALTNAPRTAKETTGKTARPLARPIDSARLGDVWAKQTASATPENELLAKIEPTLDHPPETGLRASDLEFDLSMPTRQFIDPALADEWFKLEQASLQQETASTEKALALNTPPETPRPANLATPEVRREPHWESDTVPEPTEPVSEAAIDSPASETTQTVHELSEQSPAAATAAEIVASVVKEIKQVDTAAPPSAEPAPIAQATAEIEVKHEPIPAEAEAVPADESLIAKTVLMSEHESADSLAASPAGTTEESNSTAANAAPLSPDIEEISAANETASQPTTEESEEPGFVLAAERARRWSRITTVLMSLALLLLLPLFAAQLAYTGRNYLVQWYPPSKPYLVQACQYLQCQLKLPAQIDYVNIDSHELQAQIPEKNIYSLNLLVQNQSPFAQAWPHVELILHDKREKAVLRKVFTPADYLSSQEMQRINELGLSAKGEYTIKLYFEQSNTKAAGYHVSVFYP